MNGNILLLRRQRIILDSRDSTSPSLIARARIVQKHSTYENPESQKFHLFENVKFKFMISLANSKPVHFDSGLKDPCVMIDNQLKQS